MRQRGKEGRLQRVVAPARPHPSSPPSTIYSTLLIAHAGPSLPPQRAAALVDATGALVAAAAASLPPTAAAPHYAFTPRHVAAVLGAMTRAPPELLGHPATAAALWAHECGRELRDGLAARADGDRLDSMLLTAAAAHLPGVEKVGESGGVGWEGVVAVAADPTPLPLLFQASLRPAAVAFSRFAAPPGDDADGPPPVTRVPSADALRAALAARAGGDGGLVLHADAVAATAAVARVLSSPGCHALLIGVGGAGKQSLARLAAKAAGAVLVAPPAGAALRGADFDALLAGALTTAGARDTSVALLLTEASLRDPATVATVNEVLALGAPPRAGSPDDRDAWLASCKADARATGMPDTPASWWAVFAGRVRRNLHVVLTASPAGRTLRARLRACPAIAATCTMVWFHDWTEEVRKRGERRGGGDVGAARARDARPPPLFRPSPRSPPALWPPWTPSPTSSNLPSSASWWPRTARRRRRAARRAAAAAPPRTPRRPPFCRWRRLSPACSRGRGTRPLPPAPA